MILGDRGVFLRPFYYCFCIHIVLRQLSNIYMNEIKLVYNGDVLRGNILIQCTYCTCG